MADKFSTTRYNTAPTIKHPRTRFDLSHDILTTCNNGEFVPILTEFINPGETVELKFSSLTRLETSLHQTMDNAFVEFAFFFTPLRILWTDFEKFEGANDDPWTQENEYLIPQILLGASSGSVFDSYNVSPGSLLNHLMLPVGSYGSSAGCISVEQLSLRGVFEVYNQWYRNENYDSIVYYSKASGNKELDATFLFNGSYFRPAQNILQVNRFHDRFSTLLPAPQKGQAVTLSLGNTAPLIRLDQSGQDFVTFGTHSSISVGANIVAHDGVTGSSNPAPLSFGTMGAGSPNSKIGINTEKFAADLSAATAVTVNQLRLAIVRQAMLERDARAGTRYHEIINSRWDVYAKSLELDRPELLGGKRIPLSMMEVLQTSETGTTVLGSDAGHSKTIDSSDAFVKSFTQHGVLQGFMYMRTSRSYSQGIDRMHFIKDYLDMPDPMLDKTGETACYRKEMYALKTDSAANLAKADEVAGFQEQYYWIKERINRFSGYFQSGITGTLDSWHYGDDYSDYPLISAGWMKEAASNVDRTIAVSSNAAFQYSVNIHFEFFVTRPFAKYSIPNTFGF